MARKKMEKTKKPADIRVTLPPESAEKLRTRAKLARRTLQVQAVIEIERGMGAVEEDAPL